VYTGEANPLDNWKDATQSGQTVKRWAPRDLEERSRLAKEFLANSCSTAMQHASVVVLDDMKNCTAKAFAGLGALFLGVIQWRPTTHTLATTSTTTSSSSTSSSSGSSSSSSVATGGGIDGEYYLGCRSGLPPFDYVVGTIFSHLSKLFHASGSASGVSDKRRKPHAGSTPPPSLPPVPTFPAPATSPSSASTSSLAEPSSPDAVHGK